MTREIDIFQYLPPVIQNIKEIQYLTESENPRFIRLFCEAEERLADSYIREAGIQGIKRYEKILGIASDSRLTLEERREKILIKWNRQLPYTLRRLVEQLALWSGGEKFIVDTSHFPEYVLRIEVYCQTLTALLGIREAVNEIIPANLVLNLYGRYPFWYEVPIHYENAIHFQTSFHPRYNLPYLRLDNIWALNNTHRLNGYDSDDVLDFYPVKMRVGTGAAQTIRTEGRLRIGGKLNAQIREETALRMQTETVKDIQAEEQLHVQTKAAYQPETASYMTKMNQLDNQWSLSGGRKLDGGRYIL